MATEEDKKLFTQVSCRGRIASMLLSQVTGKPLPEVLTVIGDVVGDGIDETMEAHQAVREEAMRRLGLEAASGVS